MLHAFMLRIRLNPPNLQRAYTWSRRIRYMSVEDIHGSDQTLQSERPQDKAILQGFLAGAVISGLPIEEACRLATIEAGWAPTALERVRDLASALLENLADVKSEFKLLLPGDEQPLDVRVDALAAWSRAFISGFGETEKALEWLRGDNLMFEWIIDLSYVAQGAVTEQGKTDGTDEQAYSEVVEYVSVGVRSLYERICNINVETKKTED